MLDNIDIDQYGIYGTLAGAGAAAGTLLGVHIGANAIINNKTTLDQKALKSMFRRRFYGGMGVGGLLGAAAIPGFNYAMKKMKNKEEADIE